MTKIVGLLSPHFSLSEMTRSQTAARRGFDNAPSPEAVANLQRLCVDLLEPIRALLGARMTVDSGYRCSAVNAAVGGSATSAHLDGRACDFVPVGLSLDAAFDLICESSLPFDQAIVECNGWIHVGIAKAGETPRRQALTASGGPGHWTYTEAV